MPLTQRPHSRRRERWRVDRSHFLPRAQMSPECSKTGKAWPASRRSVSSSRSACSSGCSVAAGWTRSSARRRGSPSLALALALRRACERYTEQPEPRTWQRNGKATKNANGGNDTTMTIPSSDSTSDRADAALPAQAGVSAPEPAAAAPAAARRAGRLALHFGVVLVGASALAAGVAGARAGLSAALGVALAGANLLLMQKITRAMTAGSADSAGGDAAGNPAWGLALPFKLIALVGVAYALVSSGVAQPVPLAMGFALLPLTGVFLPRPMSVPDLDPRPRAPSHPGRRRESTPSRHGQPAA